MGRLLSIRVREGAAAPFAYASSLFLLFMMLFTTASVTLRYLELWTFVGDVDVMVIALVGCIFIALPAVTIRDEHVAVDLIDQVLGAGPVRVLRWIGLLLTLVFLGLALWYSVAPAIEILNSFEVMMSLGISRFWVRLPILIGLAGAVAGAILLIAGRLAERGQTPMPGAGPGAG